MKQYISAAVCVHMGRKRENNEDNFYFNGIYLTEETREKPAKAQTVCGDPLQFYAVCDGMGGEQMGELASLITAQTLHKYAGLLKSSNSKSKTKNIDAELNRCILEANNQIVAAQKQIGAKRIGTTLAMLVVENKTARLYNVGDSRMYLFRNGKLGRLSEDDTAVANMIKMGTITPEQAKTHPRRNSLTQYVGVDPEEMIIEAHKNEFKMKNKDTFMICSDGLSDMLEESEISKILSEASNPPEAAQRLVEGALNREGRDNITVIVLKCHRGLLQKTPIS